MRVHVLTVRAEVRVLTVRACVFTCADRASRVRMLTVPAEVSVTVLVFTRVLAVRTKVSAYVCVIPPRRE